MTTDQPHPSVEDARAEAERRYPNTHDTGITVVDIPHAGFTRNAFVAGVEWAASRAVPSDRTATTEDDLQRFVDRTIEAIKVAAGTDDQTPQGIVLALAAAGLLATARPDTTTEPTDAQIKRAAAALMDGDPEYENGTYGPDDYEAMSRSALRAAWTEADQ